MAGEMEGGAVHGCRNKGGGGTLGVIAELGEKMVMARLCADVLEDGGVDLGVVVVAEKKGTGNGEMGKKKEKGLDPKIHTLSLS